MWAVVNIISGQVEQKIRSKWAEFTSDSRKLVTASDENIIKVWNVRT